MPKYLLAHDLGTSGNKATLYTEEGSLVKSTIYTYDTDYFNNNWAEQDPDDWWNAVCMSTKEIISDIQKKDIAAISFSGQMMGAVCVNRDGIPLRKAIIWADQRSITQTDRLRQKIDEKRFYKITGHRMSPSYSVEKLMWIMDNEPDVYSNTYKLLNAKDYIVFKLTGKFLTEYSDASGTNLLDLDNLKWSDEIIDASGIDPLKLPELKESTFVAGGVTKEASSETGLEEGTPVVCGGGDGVCAAVGSGCIKEGIAYNYVGSSSWIGLATKEPVYDDEMRTFNWAHIIPGYISPCGTMQCAGGSFGWLKNVICTSETYEAELKGISPYSVIDHEIEKSPAGANGVIYLPYLVGERSPRWNPYAKGAFIGLKMENTREDILRSVLEGVTLNLNCILQVFKHHADINKMIAIGGGAKGDVWMQIMADVYNMDILRPNYLQEATSMGAAVTGGVGVGLYKNFDIINRFIRFESIKRPNPDNQLIYQKMMDVFNKSYESLVDVFSML